MKAANPLSSYFLVHILDEFRVTFWDSECSVTVSLLHISMSCKGDRCVIPLILRRRSNWNISGNGFHQLILVWRLQRLCFCPETWHQFLSLMTLPLNHVATAQSHWRIWCKGRTWLVITSCVYYAGKLAKIQKNRFPTWYAGNGEKHGS